MICAGIQTFTCRKSSPPCIQRTQGVTPTRRITSMVAAYSYTRSSTTVPWSVHLRYRPFKSPRTLLSLQQLPRPRFTAALLAAEYLRLLALRCGTGGYVGKVSGDLPHSTQDVSVCILTIDSSDIYSTHGL